MSSKLRPRVVTIDPYGVAESGPIYSHVTTSTGSARLVLTAGQIGVDENGVAPNDPTEQIELALKNLQRCLDSAGASIKDIMKLVYYIVDFDSTNIRHRQPLKEFLKGHRPATTLVPVPKLAKPELIFEVEAYVSVPQEPLKQIDVVVVGAGLSGLKAAYEIQKAGLSCVVLEARDRVGGKTWSIDSNGQGKFVDLGAAWINDTNQSEVYALAQALGLKTVVQNTTGDIVQQDVDGKISSFAYGSIPQNLSEADASLQLIAVREKTEEVCQSLDIYDPVRSGAHLDTMTFEEWLISQGFGQTAIASATVWTRAMLGLEPSEMSALYFLNYCKSGGGILQMRSDQKDGGQFLRFVKGTQSLSLGLVGLLKPGTVVLSSPVRAIEQTLDGVHVTGGRGDYLCKRVVVSVPTPLYKEISFNPRLPEAKMELSRQNKLGFTNKVMIQYSSPWWRKYGLTGMIQSFTGPVAVTRDSSVDESGSFSLTCFCVGRLGRELTKLTQKERFQRVADHVKSTLGVGKDDIPEPLAFHEYEWAHDQWAQGCPCPASPPGVMTKYEQSLRTPFGKIHFIGTETAFEWKGYMDGALRSGIRGAQEVIKVLQNPKL